MSAPLIQIAFAGHNRPFDLGAHKPVLRDLAAAFQLISDAGVERARLVCGLAHGADRLAAEAWRDAGLGPLHAVYPFISDGKGDEIGPRGLAQSATWLDGVAAEKVGRNPHLEQTRWLIAAADLLVVVWNGARARGAGGTADAVRLALDRGTPVLWISPRARGRIRFIRPPTTEQGFDFSEFHEALEAGAAARIEPATAAALRYALALADEASDDVVAPKAERPIDKWLHSWLWRTNAVFRKALGGSAVARTPPAPPPPEPPADLVTQPGYQTMTEAYLSADYRANRLSAVHRSEQLLLLFAMVLAAIVGSVPSLAPGFKLVAVYIELLIGVVGLVVWQSAQRARQHEMWTEARRLAEQIRLDRAGWALGVSTQAARDTVEAHEHGYAARNVLREAGLPTGAFDATRVQSWGRWAMGELVGGQAAYHRVLSARDAQVSHRVHVFENSAFVVFLVLLGSFFVGYQVADSLGHHLPKWIAGIVVMAGTVYPAIGAAAMALEAKLEFGEQSQRSADISARLDELGRQLGDAPSSDEIQTVARAAMRLLSAEAEQWREGASRRRLFRA